MYAILSHGGRQHRVSAGDRLVVDRMDAEVGSVIALEPVLLTGGEGTAQLGQDVDGIRVAATVVKHLRGEKLRIFKYKPKKRSRKMAGYRSELTELRVESILPRGAALPRAEATAAAPKAEATAASTPVAASVAAAPAVADEEPAAKPAAIPRRTGRRASPAAAAPTGDGGVAEIPAEDTPAPTPRSSRATKSAPTTGGSGAAASKATKKATKKDSGDGA